MARRAQDDYCLICMASPCQCKAKKAPAKKTAPRATQPTPVVHPVREARPGLSAVKRMPAPPKPTPRLAPIAQAQAANEAADQELRRAVTVLVQAGLVSEESINEHRRWIDMTDAELRAVMWKQRREASGNG
jgi:hypothetical protein